MRLVPTRMNLLNDVLDRSYLDSFVRKNSSSIMRTDISEKDGNYLLAIDMPGLTKEDITINLQHGYLTVSGNKEDVKETKDDNGNIIRKERNSGYCTRSYYIGDEYSTKDITAKCENGELRIAIKAKDQKELEEKSSILID